MRLFECSQSTLEATRSDALEYYSPSNFSRSVFTQARPIADIPHRPHDGLMQARRKDPFYRERWEERLHAIRSSWKLVLLLIGLGAVFVWLLIRSQSRQLPVPEEGQVVRFGSHATDEGNKPLVLVRLRDGSERQLRIHRTQVRTCRVGGRIQLVRRGSWVGVDPMACAAS